jgi:disulfide bond formation protein DsbB
MVLAAATGAFVAGYQVWIQRFAPMTSCAGEMAWWEELVEWAGQQVPLLFRASGFCSDPAWKFLGLSIADWSLGCFGALLLLAAHALWRRA